MEVRKPKEKEKILITLNSLRKMNIQKLYEMMKERKQVYIVCDGKHPLKLEVATLS